MLFVSIDEEVKRVAHTSGCIEMVGKDPVNLPVYDPETGLGFKGLKECAMAAGCIPYVEKKAAPVVEPVAPVAAPGLEPAAAVAVAVEPVVAAKPPKAAIIKE